MAAFKRKLFISDIHGCYNEMIQLLDAASFNPAHDFLVVGGDMIDRGPDSAKVVQYLKNLQEQHPQNVIILGGNHEDMAARYIAGYSDMWLNCGGLEAVESFQREFSNQEEADEVLQWMITRPSLYGDKEFVYVHAGIDPTVSLFEQERQQVLWMPYASPSIYFQSYPVEDILKCTGGRKVIYGHMAVSSINDDGASICCDLGAAVKPKGAKLALVNLSDRTYWMYDFDQETILQDTIKIGEFDTTLR